MFLDVFRSSLLEKIAFWAIIEELFAGDAFRGVNGCCMGFDFWERQLPIGGWLILRHPNRDSCPEPLFLIYQSGLAEVKGTFPSIPACLCACLPVGQSAADPSVYALTSICLQ